MLPEEEYNGGGGAVLYMEDAETNVRNYYEYDRNCCVALKPGKDVPTCTFWIGKVTDKTRNCEGKVFSLRVHWYELHNSEDAMEVKYGQSYLTDNQRTKRKPWTGLVSTEAVMIKFHRLTRTGKLPACVQKTLQQECIKR